MSTTTPYAANESPGTAAAAPSGRHVSDEIVETAARFDANSESERRMLRGKSD